MMVDKALPDWLDASRETIDRLVEFEQLVLKWNKAVNLISRASAPEIWERHILDSAQIAWHAGWTHYSWTDIGSGGGFPALVLAVMAKQHRPDATYTVLESDGRKAAFLRQASQALGLNVCVLCQRSEDTPGLGADVLTARAVAPLEHLLGHSARHLSAGGRAFFPKGATYRDEMEAAGKTWRFNCTAHVSKTDPKAAILEVEGLELL
jgi:16S rRNA (guanine527-N7)-methyltransferase